VFQEVAPDRAALKQAVAALLGGGVQLEQITVTVSNASASASSSSSSASATDAGRRLGGEANPTPTPTPTPHHLGGEAGRGEEQGGEGMNAATAPSVWLVSVQVAYEEVGEARDSKELLQVVMPQLTLPLPLPLPLPLTLILTLILTLTPN
jgi:hypothetical protein